MVGWNSVSGKGGKADKAEARAAGLSRDWNSSDDGDIVDRIISELLQRDLRLDVTCSIEPHYTQTHFISVPRSPDKVTIGTFVRPTPSQRAIWSLMNSGVMESLER